MPGYLIERGEAPLVAFDRDHLLRALRDQRARQAPGAGADLDDDDVLQGPGGARDAACEIEIEKEVLAERFLRIEPVRRDDLAKRRQAVAGKSLRRGAAPRAAAAAIKLVGLARPLPAMSKAVPWSGEVRTNGSPRVTLTPSSKASVLAAFRP